MKRPWTEWVSPNTDGTPTMHVVTPCTVCGLQVQEKSNWGIVNLRLGFRDADGKEQWSVWLTSDNGEERTAVWLETGVEATGVTVREQGGYGLVNIRLDSSRGPSKWACPNMEGDIRTVTLRSGSIRGAQVRDQVGRTNASSFGIVNLRVGPGPLWSGMTSELLNSATWMNDRWDMIKDRALWQMVIPSSHDAASYDMPDISRTQGATLYEQLLYGLRYFDIRIATDEEPAGTRLTADKYLIYHGSDLSRFSFRDLLRDVRKFLDLTEREIFILHIRSDVEDSPKDPDTPSTLGATIGALIGAPAGAGPGGALIGAAIGRKFSYEHPKPTLQEDESIIGEMVSILGQENIVDHKFVSQLGKTFPAGCTPGELVKNGSRKRVVIVWWSNHDKEIASRGSIANNVWLSDISKNGVSTYGPSAEYEGAYLIGDDLNSWLDQCVSIQENNKTRFWYRGGDWQALLKAPASGDSPLSRMPWNIVGGDFLNHEQYKTIYDTLIGKVLGKCDFRALTSWTKWASLNRDGRSKRPFTALQPVCGIQVREIGGMGLVNLRLGYRDSGGVERWSEWLSDATEGEARGAVWLRKGVEAGGVTVREQGRYGLVNIRLDSSDGPSGWASPNMDKDWEHVLERSGGIRGAQVREQIGNTTATSFGLVNVRVCSSLPL